MKNRKKGFTVVELVIVIAVIGILSAILIPTFVGLTAKAEEAARQENLRNAYIAYAAEAADNEEIALYDEKVVLLCDKSALNAEGAKIYELDENGKWNVASNVVVANYKAISKKVENVETPVEYNGYYVFYVA